jgi:hypothetical protein
LISIKSQLVRAAAAGAIGVAAMAASVAPASAAVHGPAAVHLAGAVAAKPNTDIEGSPAKFAPAKLTAPPTKGTCSKTNYSFSVDNKTKKSQTLQDKSGSTKKTIGTLKAGEKAGICLTGSKGAKGTLYIKGSSSTLAVTLS